MKKIALGCLIGIVAIANIYADQKNKWEGLYTFEEESWGEDQVREYRWFRLNVLRIDSKTLKAIYSDGANNKTFRKFLLSAQPENDKVIFSFQADLTDTETPCETETGWRRGELFLELKENGTKDGKPVIETFWGKEDYGLMSESGGNRKNKIFFRKR